MCVRWRVSGANVRSIGRGAVCFVVHAPLAREGKASVG